MRGIGLTDMTRRLSALMVFTDQQAVRAPVFRGKYLLVLRGERVDFGFATMSHTWEIVLDVFWLAIIIFGGGWILIRTLQGSDEPVKNVFKLIATVLLVTHDSGTEQVSLGVGPGSVSLRGQF